ncbi:MAG TPA: monovalent cation/H+ antiporter complex subunit F [Acidimicrobiales bacterium]|nr:monovalent cation/H+ antiporter complex subunit F [Acidimicrobiales bacterium]
MITVATVLLALGGACFLVRVIAGPSLADRIVALDGLVVTIVAAIVLHSIRRDVEWFLDVALVVAFIGFVGTTAGARFIERRGG